MRAASVFAHSVHRLNATLLQTTERLDPLASLCVSVPSGWLPPHNENSSRTEIRQFKKGGKIKTR